MLENELTVRQARPSEAGALATLVNTAYGRTEQATGWTSEGHLIDGPRTDAKQMEELIVGPESLVLVADKDGAPRACVHLRQLEEGACELGMLAVRADAQGHGIGGQLVQAAEKRAREAMGAERIVLYVLRRREELFPWYAERGYEPTGEQEPLELGENQRSRVGPLTFEVLEKPLT